ncbi:MAG: class I SAM-dependent methyltransferase [Bryobacteraceae bacterium]|jgi:SAM-dependent methyltransferase
MKLATCPNCNSPEVLIRSGGRLLPFFTKRVFEIEPPTAASLLPQRIGRCFTWLTDAIPGLSWLGQARPLQCDILICEACDFVCPAIDITENQLLNLYRDYRSASYNAERTRYEPAYRKLAPFVGKSPAEHRARMSHVDAFLSDVPLMSSVGEVLDYAGAEGLFIPTALLERCHCTIYEVSDVSPCRPEIRKTNDPAQLGSFDYIQVCHLLEHVRRPRALMKSLIRHLRSKGMIYIEVPKEASELAIGRLRSGDRTFPIHEHINLYTERSLAALVKSVGLRLLKMGSEELDLGWCRATVLSAVGAP